MPNPLTKHNKIMHALKLKHEKLINLINNKPVCYLDIPVHGNIGDLLIMQGTLEFFKEKKINLKNTFSAYNFNEKAIKPDSVIAFHGGGNLGDLYLTHQKHREEIIEQYQDNRIIILPQTIYFESEIEYKKCCEIFKQHADLHICVRDEKSFKLAQEMSHNVYLMPDMAHQLYPIVDSNKPSKKTLFISRIDKEASDQPLPIEYDTKTDWDLLLSKQQKIIRLHKKFQFKFNHLGLNKFTSRITTALWLIYAKSLVNKSKKLFSDHETIYTSRLHGHILACLMDKTNTVLDNSYGKNSTYIEVWTADSDLIEKF